MRLLIALLFVCLLAIIVHGQQHHQEGEAASWSSFLFGRKAAATPKGKEKVNVKPTKDVMQQKRIKIEKKLWSASFKGNETHLNELLTEANRLFGNKYILEILAEANVVDQGESLLGIAAARGNVEVLQLMLSPPHNAHIETRNEYGLTPLMTACKQNRLEVVKMLLHYEHYDDNSHKAASSSSTLDAAEAAVAVAVEAGPGPASLSSKNDYGDTALLVAVKHGRSAIVKYLLSDCLVISSSSRSNESSNRQVQTIDLEEEDGEGNTALIIARLFDYNEIVDLLLANGADPAHERGSRKRAKAKAEAAAAAAATTTAAKTVATAKENQGDDL